MILDLIGRRFGRLVVQSRTKNGWQRNAQWKCICDCGHRKIVAGASLVHGATKSCGCLARELAKDRFTTHGSWRSPEYASWDGMVQRCTNPKHPKWEYYGGRGITVCERWRTFAHFLQDMGQRPIGATLDRFPNNNGNYEPGNCRWASYIEQHNNTRRQRFVEFQGETITVAELARRVGLYQELIGVRLRRGWSLEQAIEVDVR